MCTLAQGKEIGSVGWDIGLVPRLPSHAEKKIKFFVHEGDLGVRPCLCEFMLRNIV